MKLIIKKIQIISSIFQWVKLWKTLPVFDWINAVEYYEASKFKDAAALYAKGLQTAPTHKASLAARLDLAFCYTKCYEYAEAEKELRTAKKLFPNSKEIVIRLVKLLRFTGRPLEAAWTIRAALKNMAPDSELIGYFLLSALEQTGKSFLIKEALGYESRCDVTVKCAILEVARAKCELLQGRFGKAREKIISVCRMKSPPVEALLVAAELSLEMHDVQTSKSYLTRALSMYPEYPRVLGMLSELYLQTLGEDRDQFLGFARNLSEQACKSSGWKSAREIAVLAKIYEAQGDQDGAALVAEKAWSEGKSKFFSGGFGRVIGSAALSREGDGEILVQDGIMERGMTVVVDGLRVRELVDGIEGGGMM